MPEIETPEQPESPEAPRNTVVSNVGLAPTELGEVVIVETTTGLVIGFEAGSQVQTILIRLTDSSGKIRQQTVSATNINATLIEIEKGRSYQVELTPVTSTGALGKVYKTTFTANPNAANDLDMQREVGGRIGVSWTDPKGFVATYRILVQQRGKTIQEIFTTNRSALLAPFAGGAKVSLFTVGEGGKEVSAGYAIVSSRTVLGAVTARHATRSGSSLISFNAESTGRPTYKVYVNGKLVCSTKKTSCSIKQRVGALDKLQVVSNDGAESATTNYFEAISFSGQVSFRPNTVTPAADFTRELKKIAADIKKKKFKRVVVTGHANQVGAVQTASAARLAKLRGEYTAERLRKLLPGVTVVSVDRGVESPLVQRSSTRNIRAEIYATK